MESTWSDLAFLRVLPKLQCASAGRARRYFFRRPCFMLSLFASYTVAVDVGVATRHGLSHQNNHALRHGFAFPNRLFELELYSAAFGVPQPIALLHRFVKRDALLDRVVVQIDVSALHVEHLFELEPHDVALNDSKHNALHNRVV